MNLYIGFANCILYLASRLWLLRGKDEQEIEELKATRSAARLIASTFSFLDFPLDWSYWGSKARLGRLGP
jgi:hypothetical protein